MKMQIHFCNDKEILKQAVVGVLDALLLVCLRTRSSWIGSAYVFEIFGNYTTRGKVCKRQYCLTGHDSPLDILGSLLKVMFC